MGLKGPEVKNGEAGQAGEGSPAAAPAAAAPAAPAKPATPAAPATPAKPAAAAPATPATPAKPATPATPAAEKGKKKERTLNLVAPRGYQSDPFTGVKYTEGTPKPGVCREGNWIDCQMKAGLLAEYVAPVAPEEEAE